MSDFKASIRRVVRDKKGYKEYRRRITALPVEYRQAFQEIEKYVWHFLDYSGINIFSTLIDSLNLSEKGTVNGTPIKDVTGEKVGDSTETIVNEVAGKWTDKQKEKLNHQFSKQQSKQKRGTNMAGNFFKEGELLTIPKKNAKKVQVFQRMANRLELGKEYTEKEVSQRLREIYEDYALLRRYLVDYQCLERDEFGRTYQKCEQHTRII